jgi:hypothetical protein
LEKWLSAGIRSNLDHYNYIGNDDINGIDEIPVIMKGFSDEAVNT